MNELTQNFYSTRCAPMFFDSPLLKGFKCKCHNEDPQALNYKLNSIELDGAGIVSAEIVIFCMECKQREIRTVTDFIKEKFFILAPKFQMPCKSCRRPIRSIETGYDLKKILFLDDMKIFEGSITCSKCDTEQKFKQKISI